MRSFSNPFDKSIRLRLLFVFVLVAVVPLAISAVISYQKSSEVIQSQTVTDLQTMAEQKSDVISDFMNERVRAMMGVAANSDVLKAAKEQASGNLSQESFKTASSQLKGEMTRYAGYFENVLVADPTGKNFVDGQDGKTIGGDLSVRPYFKEALSGKVTVGDPTPSLSTGRPVTAVAVPMVDGSGKVVGVAVGAVELATVGKKLNESKVGSKGYSVLLNRDGLALVHPDEKQVLKANFAQSASPSLAAVVGRVIKGETGVGEYQMEDGARRLLGYAPVKASDDYKGQGFAVGVVAVYDEVMAPLQSLLYSSLAMVLIVVVLVVAVSFQVARSIATPLAIIDEYAAHVATGDVFYDIGEQRRKKTVRKDEIGHIAESFRAVRVYLSGTADVAQAIARGDLTVNVTPKSREDLLGNAFVEMLSSLRASIGQVSAVAGNLNQASAQLSSASSQAGAATNQITTTIQEVARGTQDQSASVQETTTSVDQLSRAIDQIALGSQEQARAIEKTSATVVQLNSYINRVAVLSNEVHSTTEQSKTVAMSGGESVQKTLSGMAAIRESTTSVGKSIQELANHSEQIGSIVEAIDDIAEQTNLLALNAAIEAARAGEHGRGFAVVADEVRKLAERSSKETKQIAQLISQVQRGTHEAVAAMDQGSKEVDQGLQLAEEAGEALKGILEGAQGAAEQVGQIVAAVKQMETASRQVADQMDSVSAVVEQATASAEEMAASSQQVTAAIEKVAAVSEETSASAEEVSASTEEMSAQVEEMVAQAEELARMAEDLQAAVSIFKLDQDGARGEVAMRRRSSDWSDARPVGRLQER